MFSLEDGMRFACARGALMSGMADGAMAAVFAPSARVAAAVEAHNAAWAALDSASRETTAPTRVVSGPVEEIEAISGKFDGEGVRVRRLNTRKAFHSALVEPIVPALEESLEGVAVASPSLAVVSNLTGRPVEPGQTLDGSYWRRHAREAVAFARGVESLAELVVDLVVEIGPRSVLAPMALSAWPESPGTPAPAVLSTLSPPGRRSGGAPGRRRLRGGGRRCLRGRAPGPVRGALRRGGPAAHLDPGLSVPAKAPLARGPQAAGTRSGPSPSGVPARVGGAARSRSRRSCSLRIRSGWDDHRVFGRVVAPGALYGAMAVAAARAEGRGVAAVEDVQLHNALVFTEEESGNGTAEAGRRMQLVLDAGRTAGIAPIPVVQQGQ